MDIETLTIGQAKEAINKGREIEAALHGKANSSPASGSEDHGLQIAVLDRGWVYVGKCVTNGTWLTITNAKCIRRWGTTKGLGELADNGPLDETLLDNAGTVKVATSALKFFVACTEARWS